jgi:hypothetical protein
MRRNQTSLLSAQQSDTFIHLMMMMMMFVNERFFFLIQLLSVCWWKTYTRMRKCSKKKIDSLIFSVQKPHFLHWNWKKRKNREEKYIFTLCLVENFKHAYQKKNSSSFDASLLFTYSNSKTIPKWFSASSSFSWFFFFFKKFLVYIH